mgnify:CR=1 FL=1
MRAKTSSPGRAPRTRPARISMPPILLSKYGSAARKPHLASQLPQILTLGKFLQDAVGLDEFDDCYGLLALRRLRAALLVSPQDQSRSFRAFACYFARGSAASFIKNTQPLRLRFLASRLAAIRYTRCPCRYRADLRG